MATNRKSGARGSEYAPSIPTDAASMPVLSDNLSLPTVIDFSGRNTEGRPAITSRIPKPHPKRSGRQRRVSRNQKEIIIGLHAKGIRSTRIADSLGLHVTAVRALLWRRGLAKHVRPISAQLLHDLYCDQGLSMSAVARKIGMPKTNVEHWMKNMVFAHDPCRNILGVHLRAK